MSGWTAAAAPEIECPACGEVVKQVASATLSLALWQHYNWVCKRLGMTPSADPNSILLSVPQGEFDYEQLDAGVREVVRRLRDAGFETTDSGDGVSKPEEWYESGEAMRVPNVAAVVAPQRLLAESQRFAAVLGDGWHVEATYFPQSGTAVLLGTSNQPVPQGEREKRR